MVLDVVCVIHFITTVTTVYNIDANASVNNVSVACVITGDDVAANNA